MEDNTGADTPEIQNVETSNEPEKTMDEVTIQQASTNEPAEVKLETDEEVKAPDSIKKPKKSKKLLVVIIAVVILAICIAAVWYFVFFNKTTPATNNNNASPQNTDTDKLAAITEVDPQVLKFITPTTGETWLEEPVKIAKQGFLKTKESGTVEGEAGAEYYQVGSRGDSTIILCQVQGMGYSHFLFEKATGGEVAYIIHPDGNAVYNQDSDDYYAGEMVSSVVISNDVHYDSLSIPDQIKLDDKGGMVTSPVYTSLGQPYTKATSNQYSTNKETLIRQLGSSQLYKLESTSLETELVSISYFIKTPFATKITLGYEPLDLSMTGYKWNAGYSSSSDTLQSITRGCGSFSASVTRSDSITDADVQVAGKSSDNLTVYSFSNDSHPLLLKAYEEFKEYNSYDTQSMYANMSISDFVKQHGLVIYKDVYGQWLVYVNIRLAPSGGCAKPVVYLYPETVQAVTVKVGADVKVSDPYYNPATGWEVLANPDGQLTLNGRTYGSLFWEGPGYGQYPEITEGTVVEQADLISTIRDQLTQQGLNKTEINDFIDYWQDRLPTNSYVRLTWFNTQQMDQLAPLQVSPKPDTMIRVFLDANGLDQPISIPKQILKSTPRDGFTLVEWGGLSIRKLY